jgi:hypothetical protein
MAELVDAPASGAGTRKGVEVRVLFWAPFHIPEYSGKSKNLAFAGFFVAFFRIFILSRSSHKRGHPKNLMAFMLGSSSHPMVHQH